MHTTPSTHRTPAWRNPCGAFALTLAGALLLGAPAAFAQEGTGGGAPPAAGSDAELTADQIVDLALETNQLGFQRGEAQLVLIIQDEQGDQRERRLHIRSMREDDLNRALVRILAPAEVAGQSYLFVENAGDAEDDIFIYLPALDDAPRRIAGNQRDEAFMGSNITYADLESRDIRGGTYTRHADEEIGGFPVYVIDAVAEGSQYSYARMWIRKSDYVPLRVRFFGPGDTVVKTMFTEEVAETQGRTYVRRMSMSQEGQGSTTMIVESIDFEAQVSPSEFTRENLTN